MREQPVIIGRMGGIEYISGQTKRNRTDRPVRLAASAFDWQYLALGENGDPFRPPEEKRKEEQKREFHYTAIRCTPRFFSFSQ